MLEGLPGDLKGALQQYVDYYNYKRYHESLNNLTPADVNRIDTCSTVYQLQLIQKPGHR